MVTQKREFVLHQFYEVTIDPSAIDKTSYANEETRALMERMVQAIIADPVACVTVMRYQVLARQDAATDDEAYRQEAYGNDTAFADILVLISGCFREDDRQWLLAREKEYSEMHARYEQVKAALPRGASLSDEDYGRIGYFERDDFEPISDCFEAEPSGWHLHEVSK